MDLKRYQKLLEEYRWDEAEKLRQSSIPNKLIKFFSLTDDEEENEKRFISLENEEMWFSHPSKLNDPYEFKTMVVDEKRLREAGWPSEIIEQFKDLILFDDIGLSCLTSNNVDCTKMWAYYANSHKGYCVEYEVHYPGLIHEVIYEPRRIPIAALLTKAYEAAKHSMKTNRTTPETKLYMRILSQNMYIKGMEWKEEAEYRIAYPIDNKIGKNVKIKEIGLKTKRIIAGYDCKDIDLQRLNHISNMIGCGNVYQCQLRDSDYGVNIQRVK